MSKIALATETEPYSQTTRQLGMVLRWKLGENEHLSSFTDSWESLLRHAGDHLIVAGLAAQLKNSNRTTLPGAAQDYINSVYNANRERNERLTACFEACVAILNTVGISPTPLKGLAMIYEPVYRDPSERITSDLDLYIDPSELRTALVALRDAGYRQINNQYDPGRVGEKIHYEPINVDDFRNSEQLSRYHIPPIVDNDAEFSIEIHIAPTRRDSLSGARLNSLVEKGIQIVTEPVCWTMSSDMFKFYQNFHHSQVKDQYQFLGIIDWRHLIDARHLLERTDDQRLIVKCMNHAIQTQIDREFYCFLAQLVELLDCDINLQSYASPVRVKYHQKFCRLTQSASIIARHRLLFRTYKFFHMLTPNELRKTYGPVSLPSALGRWLRYRYHLRKSRNLNP